MKVMTRMSDYGFSAAKKAIASIVAVALVASFSNFAAGGVRQAEAVDDTTVEVQFQLDDGLTVKTDAEPSEGSGTYTVPASKDFTFAIEGQGQNSLQVSYFQRFGSDTTEGFVPLRTNLITPPMTNLRNLPKVTTHSRQGSARRPILPTQLPAKRAPKMGQLPTRKLPTRQRARIRILPRISRSSSQFPKRPPCCSSAIKMQKRLLRLLPSKQARRKLSKRPALL